MSAARESTPLSTLLSRCLASLASSYVTAGAGSASDPSLAVWRNLLRVTTSEGDTEAELVGRSSVSRRAMRSMVTRAARGGLVTEEPSGVRGAGQRVRLAAAGEEASVRWPAIEAAAVEEWGGTVGVRRAARLRRAAGQLVPELGLEWPHHPVTYGGADPSVTGGTYRKGSDGPPRIPAHGKDWKPVARPAGDVHDVDDLPVDALLSQLLCAFASDYEQIAGPIALAMALRRTADEWVPVSEFPAEAHVTGEGKSLLERHGFVSLRTDASAPKPKGFRGNEAKPSPLGKAARDAHEPVTAHVEAQWREALGADVVDDLRVRLEEIVARLPDDLPDHFLRSPMDG